MTAAAGYETEPLAALFAKTARFRYNQTMFRNIKDLFAIAPARKEIRDWLNKMSVAAFAVGLFQSGWIALFGILVGAVSAYLCIWIAIGEGRLKK